MGHIETKKRVVGYVRVSTEAQVEGESPKTQESSIKEYCSAQKWGLISIEKDLGISGHKSGNRPGWRKIMKMAESGEVDVVMCLKLSRIARNAREALNIEHELRQRGVALVSLKEKFDTTTPSGKLSFQVLSMIAEFEREVIREQMSENKMAKWRRKEMFTGHAPFGYRWSKEEGKMVVNPEEAELLNRIFRLYANSLLSMKEITIKLNSEGSRSRRASWTNGTLSGIFENPVYGTCELVTNKHVYDESKRTQELKPESEWITFEVPRIVSLSLWNKVQERREFNKKKQKRSTWQQEFWLRDNMTCSRCGGKLVAKRGNSRKDGSFPMYYACFWGATSEKDLLSANRERCNSTYIYAKRLEDYVWNRLTGSLVGNWFLDDEEKRLLEAENRFNDLFGSENIDNRISETKNAIQQIRKKILGKERANQSFAEALERDDADVSFFIQRIRQNQHEINQLKGNISEFENTLAELKDIQQDKQFFLENSDILFDAWQDMQHFSAQDKKRFLESLVPGGIVINTDSRINDLLGHTTVDVEIVFNSDIFQTFIDEGKFPSFSKNSPDHSTGHDLR